VKTPANKRLTTEEKDEEFEYVDVFADLTEEQRNKKQ